ncbi:hypothetical protein ACFWXH_30195 [Mesorhizobium sp. NPDC059054]|uniref:hypothetical protein n=1 Tax=Mesorhizobium sp. NPDC059054 TaxID=3346711 RepID=UPI003698F25B
MKNFQGRVTSWGIIADPISRTHWGAISEDFKPTDVHNAQQNRVVILFASEGSDEKSFASDNGCIYIVVPEKEFGSYVNLLERGSVLVWAFIEEDSSIHQISIHMSPIGQARQGEFSSEPEGLVQIMRSGNPQK